MSSAPWQPRRPTVILIGALTAWPIVYFFLFMGFIFFSFASIGGHGHGNPSGNASFDAFKYIIAIHLLTMLLMFTLTAMYVVHAFRTDLIAEDRRVLWVIILFFGNLLAFPVYWYLYLWRTNEKTSS